MPITAVAPLLFLLLLCNSPRFANTTAVGGDKLKSSDVQLSRRTKQTQQHRLLQTSSLCSCSPTIFNIQINFHSDPCKLDKLEDNSGIKGTLCLVGQTESGSGAESEGMEVKIKAPSSLSDSTSNPISSYSNTAYGKMPTFSPTINPTFETRTSVTRDPFLPPAGAMPKPRPDDAWPTYSPTTPYPTYATYAPTSSTYAPTYSTYAPTYTTYAPTSSADGQKRANFIEPVKGDVPPSAQTTYYPTVDDTYAPTEKQQDHGVASMIKRANKMDTSPSVSYTYAPSTPFPTFDSYSPTLQIGSREKQGVEEPRRKLLEVINLDELDMVSHANDSGQTMSGMNRDILQDSTVALTNNVRAWRSIPPNDDFFTRFPEWKKHQEEIYRLRHNDKEAIVQAAVVRDQSRRQSSRIMQSSIAVPTQLISAQFLEIDTSSDMTIINQDDSYLNLTDFNEEDMILSYTSISATLDPSVSLEDQIDAVPGGAILVLIGQDESGELVRNRLMWTYTMKCGMEIETVSDRDEFGWALFVSIVG